MPYVSSGHHFIMHLVKGSQNLPELMTTGMQPPASLGSTTIEAPLAERRFRWKAGAAPIKNVEKERFALLLYILDGRCASFP